MLPPACTVTNTNVVESQASVLPDSGASVGMVYATTSTDSTGIGVHSLMPGVYPQRPRGMQNDGWKVIAGREFPPHVLRQHALIADGGCGVVVGPRGDFCRITVGRVGHGNGLPAARRLQMLPTAIGQLRSWTASSIARWKVGK